MWVEKYRPETLSEVMGNDYAKEEFLRWIGRYRAGNVREKGVFLVGPQGVGKTSFVHAAAKDNVVVVENDRLTRCYRSLSLLKDNTDRGVCQ